MNLDLVTRFRECSNVQRCHTLPHHGDYTVGKHSFDAVMLLFALHPNPSVDLIRYVAMHDFGERWVGDLPAPAKWAYYDLGETYQNAERSTMIRFGISLPELKGDDRSWADGVDKLELWLWCQEQLALGNKHVTQCLERVEAYLRNAENFIPSRILNFMDGYTFQRTDEI